MTTVRFIVEGRVQGVGFRRYVLHQAHQLNVTGFVANLEDGRVECVAQGSSDAVTELEMRLRQGPRLSKVTSVTCIDVETEPRMYNQFRIV